MKQLKYDIKLKVRNSGYSDENEKQLELVHGLDDELK